ncbi:MAG: hypothetical protein QOE61_5398, partial [Micromonosporaceae bacterium]|nr:hypothetical protein [Micromonosporaceae bacterium]
IVNLNPGKIVRQVLGMLLAVQDSRHLRDTHPQLAAAYFSDQPASIEPFTVHVALANAGLAYSRSGVLSVSIDLTGAGDSSSTTTEFWAIAFPPFLIFLVNGPTAPIEATRIDQWLAYPVGRGFNKRDRNSSTRSPTLVRCWSPSSTRTRRRSNNSAAKNPPGRMRGQIRPAAHPTAPRPRPHRSRWQADRLLSNPTASARNLLGDCRNLLAGSAGRPRSLLGAVGSKTRRRTTSKVTGGHLVGANTASRRGSHRHMTGNNDRSPDRHSDDSPTDPRRQLIALNDRTEPWAVVPITVWRLDDGDAYTIRVASRPATRPDLPQPREPARPGSRERHHDTCPPVHTPTSDGRTPAGESVHPASEGRRRWASAGIAPCHRKPLADVPSRGRITDKRSRPGTSW